MKIIVLMLWLLLPRLSDAATYYVAKTCTGGGACLTTTSCTQAQTLGTARLTINSGAACLSGGDTLLIGNGTYIEMINNADSTTNIPSGTAPARTTIRAKDGLGGVIIQPTTQPAAIGIDNSHWILIQDLIVDSINQGSSHNHAVSIVANSFEAATNIEFRNVEAKNAGGAGFRLQGGYHKCINCWAHNNGRNGGAASSVCGNGIYLQSTESLVENSRIEDNGIPDVCSAAITGLDPATGRTALNTIVRNNTIRNNGQYVITSRNTRMAIYNNLIYGNGFLRDSVATMTLATGDTAYNNTIVSNAKQCLSGGGATVRNNICHANTPNTITGTGTISNNLTADPKFINAGAGNFQLQPSSPAINAGISTAPTVTTDFLGVARPNGTAYDIGAYEYVPAGGGGPTGVPGAPTGMSLTP